MRELRFALRRLAKSPGFAAVAVLTLALGIGANTAMFSVISAVLLRPLPFRDPANVVVVTQRMQSGAFNVMTTAVYLAWKQQGGDLDRMGVYTPHVYNFAGQPLAERMPGSQVSRELFPVVGVAPMLGRNFNADEDRPGGPAVVILSHSLWRDRFGSDRDIIGKTANLDGATATIVGVMPQGFHLINPNELLWTPLQLPSSVAGNNSNVHWLFPLMRLPDGADLKQVQARLDAVAARMHRDNSTDEAGYGVVLQTLRDWLTGSIQPVLALLMGAVGLVLLIACSNVANLLLARGSGRRHEISICLALGAPRRRIVRQLLTESALLAFFGGLAGVVLAYALLQAVLAAQSATVLGVTAVSVDRTVLAYTVLICASAGMIFGIAPALDASRAGALEALKEGARGSSGAFGRYRTALIIAETALASLLLIAAGLALKSMSRLTAVPPGFDPHHVLTFRVTVPARVPLAQMPTFYQQVQEHVAAIPGVQAAVLGRDLPMSGTDPSMPVIIDGKMPPVTPGQIVTRLRIVGPSYFAGLKIPMLRGREFNDADTAAAEPVVVVSRSLVERFWPGEDGVGKRLRPDIAGAPWYTIVGVAADVRHWTADVTDYEPTAYYPYTQVPQSVMGITLGKYMTFAVRTGGATTGLASSVQNAVAAVDKTVPVYNVQTMDALVDNASSVQRLNMSLLGTFAALALALAAIGVYGVMSYSVAQRTREIGIRMALGARAVDVLGLVVRQGARHALIGIAIGLAGSAALGRVLSAIVYGISPRDLTIFAAVPAVLLAAILLACYVPARRAARVDPVIALRYE